MVKREDLTILIPSGVSSGPGCSSGSWNQRSRMGRFSFILSAWVSYSWWAETVPFGLNPARQVNHAS